jgi:hypothetical protein
MNTTFGSLEDEVTLTQVLTSKPLDFVPSHPTTYYPLQYNAVQQLSPDTLASIAPSAMKQVGIGYGGLKGYAYTLSLVDFCGPLYEQDPVLRALVDRTCDSVSKGVYGFEQALRKLSQIKSDSSDNSGSLQELPLVPVRLDNLDEHGEEDILRNNQEVISYLSARRAGRMAEPLTDSDNDCLLRLQQQITYLAVKHNNIQLQIRIKQ